MYIWFIPLNIHNYIEILVVPVEFPANFATSFSAALMKPGSHHGLTSETGNMLFNSVVISGNNDFSKFGA